MTELIGTINTALTEDVVLMKCMLMEMCDSNDNQQNWNVSR